MPNLKEYLITLLATKNIESIVDFDKVHHITRKILRYIATYPNSSTND
jgi:hypothetical protein